LANARRSSPRRVRRAGATAVGSGGSGTRAPSHWWCSRPARHIAATGFNLASTPPTCVVDHGRWPTVANRSVVSCELMHLAGRTGRGPRPRPARAVRAVRPRPAAGSWPPGPAFVRRPPGPRPVSQLASGSLSREPRSVWGWSCSGPGVGPAPSRPASAVGCLVLPGRAVCRALGPGGRWTPWHAERPQGQAVEPTKRAMYQDCRSMAGSGAGLVGGPAFGWGSGMPR
jgi:hypothetical protein